MKQLGYLLIALGAVAGSLVSVLEVATVLWTYYVVALAVGGAGAALVHIAERQRTQDVERMEANLHDLEASLDRIIEHVEALHADKDAINPYDMRHRLDERLPDDLLIFVEARESIAHAYSLQAYADVMSHFAAGERYLHRVWSASADGYIDEVHAYLPRAAEQFEAARDQLRRAAGTTPAP